VRYLPIQIIHVHGRECDRQDDCSYEENQCQVVEDLGSTAPLFIAAADAPEEGERRLLALGNWSGGMNFSKACLVG